MGLENSTPVRAMLHKVVVRMEEHNVKVWLTVGTRKVGGESELDFHFHLSTQEALF